MGQSGRAGHTDEETTTTPGIPRLVSTKTTNKDGIFTVTHSFMDDIARIATFDYVPSDREFFIWGQTSGTSGCFAQLSADDIIKARIRTMGVEEHRFVVEKGAHPLYFLNRSPIDFPPGQDANVEYYITDVGGGRHQVN
jgi:hypothetical protein